MKAHEPAPLVHGEIGCIEAHRFTCSCCGNSVCWCYGCADSERCDWCAVICGKTCATLAVTRKLTKLQMDRIGIDDDTTYNFGALNRLLPAGYAVHYNGSHYQAVSPDGRESEQHWSPHACLRWCRIDEGPR